MNNPQLNKNGELQHLLSTEGLPARILRDILDKASGFLDLAGTREIKKTPLLHGKSVFNIFFENSTRTPSFSTCVGNSVFGAITRTSGTPNVVSACICERATRECSTSPTMATRRL